MSEHELELNVFTLGSWSSCNIIIVLPSGLLAEESQVHGLFQPPHPYGLPISYLESLVLVWQVSAWLHSFVLAAISLNLCYIPIHVHLRKSKCENTVVVLKYLVLISWLFPLLLRRIHASTRCTNTCTSTYCECNKLINHQFNLKGGGVCFFFFFFLISTKTILRHKILSVYFVLPMSDHFPLKKPYPNPQHLQV